VIVSGLIFLLEFRGYAQHPSRPIGCPRTRAWRSTSVAQRTRQRRCLAHARAQVTPRSRARTRQPRTRGVVGSARVRIRRAPPRPYGGWSQHCGGV